MAGTGAVGPAGPAKAPRRGSKPNGAGAAAASIRDAVLAAADLRSETVPVPEWGVTVQIRTLTIADREAFENEVGEIDLVADNANSIARIVAMTTFDAGGDRVFAPADIPQLAAKASKPLMRLFNIADRLNSITEGQREVRVKN